MGVSTNIYVFWGIKLDWHDDLNDVFETYWEQDRQSELPSHVFDAMSGSYMMLGVQLFDSGDMRWGLDGGDLYKCVKHVDLPGMESEYKHKFMTQFPEFAHVMHTPFEIHMFIHYS